MKHSIYFTVFTLVGLALLAGPVTSDDKAAGKKKDKAPTKDEMMAAWMKAATPGPEHKALNHLAGSWTFTSKMWMEPGQPPSDSKGTSETRWILGGRFLAQDVTGEFMGMPFQGYGLSGYDNIQKKYVGAWMDSFTTAISQSVGTADSTGKVITYYRDDVDPATGEKKKAKEILRITGRDTHEMDMYMIEADGKEFKMMELRFTRKK